MHLRIRIWIFLVSLALCGSAAAAQKTDDTGAKQSGKTKTKAKSESRARKQAPAFKFSGTFELQIIYDDNILRASDGTILEFRQNSEPQKFKIKTYDDLIVSPKLAFNISKPIFGKHDTSIRLGFTLWHYSQNPIKNNDAWSVRLRQQTFKRDFVEASYTYAPPAYIRELSDRPPYTPRSTPIVWGAFKSSRNAFTLGYSRRVSDKIIARLDLGRTIRFYNRPFLENDNWEWNVAGNASFSLNPYVRLNGRYGFSNVQARAHDSIDETEDVSDDGDPSYKRDLYEFEVDLFPRKRMWKISMIALTGQYQDYYYTSDRPPWEDDLHVGRNDEVLALEGVADTTPLVGPVVFSTGYRYSQRRSSLPANVGADAADEKDYTDNRVWVSAVYPF